MHVRFPSRFLHFDLVHAYPVIALSATYIYNKTVCYKFTSKRPALIKAARSKAIWFSTKSGRVLARCGSSAFPSSATKPSINLHDSCIFEGSASEQVTMLLMVKLRFFISHCVEHFYIFQIIFTGYRVGRLDLSHNETYDVMHSNILALVHATVF